MGKKLKFYHAAKSYMGKRLKFHHTAKWYMHRPQSLLENETHKILHDFEIETDHLIPARRANRVLVNHIVKIKESKKMNKYSDLARELRKLWNIKVKVLFTNPSAREGYDTRSIFKRSLTGLNSEFSFS